ncbi:MAG: hypothetical protein NC124_08295 [Clostridium sp.]|nr:hypothetical protein [Clostridium sp.]
MEDRKRTREEYGGFLPLELNPGQELFARYEKFLLRFNSVKAALAYLLDKLPCRKIYIPYYYCPSTTDAIKTMGKEVYLYHVDDQLMPIAVPDERDSGVLLVDYFGVRDGQVNTLAKSFQSAEVIIDWAHSFYAAPVIERHIHNLYSAKKFFGVPDGAYLISAHAVSVVQVLTEAYAYGEYLMLSYEKGTNAAYAMKKEADSVISGNYGYMSKLAIGLLRNVDYERVAERRSVNYMTLHRALKSRNELELPENCIPYQYPMLVRGRGRNIKRKLIEDRIFVSTLWSGQELMSNGNPFELDMVKHCIFLPLDQRYHELDMEYIAGKVKEWTDENT